ncbi:MAG: DNA/RNA non-specific endonuclease [Sphingobacteriaceae bacterium]|nr:MAG: DNA/RNA non-specific endonuclease [Sphingobacteriaceae bacterium]
MYLILNYHRVVVLLAAIFLLNACGGNNQSSTPPANPTAVSYGGNYSIAQNFTEDFEQGQKKSYGTGNVAFKTGAWLLQDALTGNSEADHKSGKQAVRLKSNGKLTMLFEVNGAAAISLKHAVYGDDGPSTWALFVAVNGDHNFTQTGSIITSSSKNLQAATFTIQKSGRLRFEIRKLSGGKNRINIDDFTITGTQDVQSGENISVSTGDTVINPKPLPDTNTVAEGDNSNLLCGNPSGATTDESNYNNYLINQQYYMESYSRDKGGPNWVCWHLGNTDLGSVNRLNNFRADTKLPAGWYEVQNYSYKDSGFDKGHNCPSGDRTNTTDANSATFLMNNIIPQAPYNNQRTWEHLESFCRNQVQLGNEVYVIMGSYGTGGTGAKGYAETIDQGRVNVPAHIWKVAVIIPKGNNDLQRINSSATLIAIDTPNDNSINPDWQQYVCTVRDIERKTGYNLFSNLPVAVQNAIEITRYGGTPKVKRQAY